MAAEKPVAAHGAAAYAQEQYERIRSQPDKMIVELLTSHSLPAHTLSLSHMLA
jgi:hypothetical protein